MADQSQPAAQQPSQAQTQTPTIQTPIPPHDQPHQQQQQQQQQQPPGGQLGYPQQPYPPAPQSPTGYQAPPSPGGFPPATPYGAPQPFQQHPQGYYGQPPQPMYYPQQPSYGQAPPQQPPYGQAPPQQPPYGQAPPQQPPYGQAPPQQPPYGQQPHPQQPPYGAPAYGQPANPYYPQHPPLGYQSPQGYPPVQGYAPAYGQPVGTVNPATTGQACVPVVEPQPQVYSPGYAPFDSEDGYDPTTDVAIIRKALTKDARLDLDALLKILPKLTPQQIEKLKPLMSSSPQELTKNSVYTDESVRLGVHALLMGPKDFDANMLNYALTGGSGQSKTKFGSSSFKYTWILSLVLLNRHAGDIEAIKHSYRSKYGDTLVHQLRDALRKDPLLSNLYMNVIENQLKPGLSEVTDPVAKTAVQAQIDKDADGLFTATVGNVEGSQFAWVFTTSSKERLKDISAAYKKKQNISLTSTVEKKLKKSEAFRDELLYILSGLHDDTRNARDADLLENTMKGFGTKDTQLIFRIISIAWDKERLSAVKEAYKRRYATRGDLLSRIDGDTSGDQAKFLKAIVMSDGKR